MQNKKWWLGPAVVALALSAPLLAHAQEDDGMDDAPAPAQKAKPAKPRAAKAPATGKLNKRTKAALEAALGVTLTPEQETVIAQAAREQLEARKAAEAAYNQKVAAALGLSAEEFAQKEKAYRDKQKAEREAKAKG